MFSKFVTVVENKEILERIGFEETGFKNWVIILVDNPILRSEIVVGGDYVFLKNMNPKSKTPALSADIVTLWNWDIAGCISEENLLSLVRILKEGNVRKKK